MMLQFTLNLNNIETTCSVVSLGFVVTSRPYLCYVIEKRSFFHEYRRTQRICVFPPLHYLIISSQTLTLILFMYLLKIKPVQHISETVISIRNIFLKTFRYSLINCLLHLVNMKETNYDIQVKNHIQHPMHKLIPHLAIHSRPSLSCF